jgi:hypothetical protein
VMSGYVSTRNRHVGGDRRRRLAAHRRHRARATTLSEDFLRPQQGLSSSSWRVQRLTAEVEGILATGSRSASPPSLGVPDKPLGRVGVAFVIRRRVTTISRTPSSPAPTAPGDYRVPAACSCSTAADETRPAS